MLNPVPLFSATSGFLLGAACGTEEATRIFFGSTDTGAPTSFEVQPSDGVNGGRL
jgi:hypothetical protein